MQACQNPDIKDGLTAHELTQYISCIDTLKSQAALKLISRVDLTKGNITIAINKKELEKLLKGSSNLIETERLTFSEPITFQRRQNGTKLFWPNMKQARDCISSRPFTMLTPGSTC